MFFTNIFHDSLKLKASSSVLSILRKLGGVQKNIRAGKINEKKFMRQPINPKKYSCYDLKKFIQGICYPQKIPAVRKFPTPPKTFLMVRT